MKGWVLSREGEGRIWRPHYLTLKGTKLEYHRRDRKGYFPLTGCEVWSNDGFSFSIRAPNGKILSINTATQEIRDEWMVKLEQVIAYLEKKDTSDVHSKISGQNISYAEELLEYTNRVKDYLEHERLQVEARIRHNIEHDIKPPLQGSDGIYRIISLDGGGMRGVMNCIILDRLLKVFPDLLSRVNMFVGTSNGGMLAMAFAFGYSPAVCRSVLELSGRHVFKREGSAAGYGIKTAKFSSAPLEILCREIYGKHTLSNCFTHVLLPSLLLDNGSAVPMKRSCETRYYHNLPRKARRSGSQSVSNRKVRAVSVTVNGEERTNIVNTVRVSVGDSARYPYQSYSSTTSSVEGEERVATLSSSEDELSTNREEEKERRGEEITSLENNSETTKEQNEKEAKDSSEENGPTEESPNNNKCKKANEDEEEMEEEYNPMINELASDVVLRTAAAPTYFPSFQQHVDGGMFAHDPASAALTYAISPNYLAKNLKDVRLLSFGTGKVNHYYEDENHDWGYVQWVPKLTNLLWDGMIMHSENICRELLGERYYRFNPVLETEIALDNPLAIPELVETAKKLDLSALVEWIGEQFYSPSSSSSAT
ncbi:putative sporulation hydrolase CotR [Balamuthia mandrillaris]